MKQPIKMTPGDDLHLSLLMAPHSLNLAVSQFREQLLGYGRVAFEAGMKNAADLVQELADLYIAEHAETDPDTGSVIWHHRDFGFDWYNQLEELAQKLQARAALAATPAAAEQVPQGFYVSTSGELKPDVSVYDTPAAAAPVVLPEPVAMAVVHGRKFENIALDPFFKLAEGGHNLYTEQQVRALLATGGQAQAGEVLGWVHKTKSGKIGHHFYTYEPHCDSSVRDGGGEKIAVIAASGAAPQAQADARDAERYRALRDERNQLHEDDISVSDSSFNTYFGDELDKASDALIARNAAIAAAKEE